MLHFAIYVYSMVYTINYILYVWTMGTVQTCCLSPSPPFAVVDCSIWWVGTYNEMTIVDWYVGNDIMSVPILSHKDNYYIFIPNDYVFIGGGADRYIYIYIYISTIRLSCCHATMYSYCLVVIYMYILCRVQFILYNQIYTVRLNDGNCTPPSAIVDCYIWWHWYVQWNDNNGLVYWWWWCWIMSTYLLNLLSCPWQTFPTSIITTLSYQALAYLLVVLVVIYIYIYIWVQFVCDTI